MSPNPPIEEVPTHPPSSASPEVRAWADKLVGTFIFNNAILIREGCARYGKVVAWSLGITGGGVWFEVLIPDKDRKVGAPATGFIYKRIPKAVRDPISILEELPKGDVEEGEEKNDSWIRQKD